MKDMYHYASTSVALDELAKQGYQKDYNENEEEVLANPDHFQIEQIYRYEGMSNPDDESCVYAIINTKTQEKGIFVAGNLAFESNKVAKLLLEIEIDMKKREG